MCVSQQPIVVDQFTQISRELISIYESKDQCTESQEILNMLKEVERISLLMLTEKDSIQLFECTLQRSKLIDRIETQLSQRINQLEKEYVNMQADLGDILLQVIQRTKELERSGKLDQQVIEDMHFIVNNFDLQKYTIDTSYLKEFVSKYKVEAVLKSCA